MNYSAFALLSLFALSTAHLVQEEELRVVPQEEPRLVPQEEPRLAPPPELRVASPVPHHERSHAHGHAQARNATGGSCRLTLEDAWNGKTEFPTIEICTWDLSYEVGDGCFVPVATENLTAKVYDHVFETACDDHNVIITMDLNDTLPSHVTKMNPYNNHWTELFPDPADSASDGCRVYAIVTEKDIDPAKEPQGRRFLKGSQSQMAAVHHGDDYLFPLAQDHRKLGSCSSYVAIRLAIQYDSSFCAQYENNAEKAKAAIQTIIDVMNKYYQEYPLCFTIQSCSIVGYCSAGSDPLASILSNAADLCSSSDSLADGFRSHVNGNHPAGCDSTHLVFGATPSQFTGSAAGCAFRGALCVDAAVGVNCVTTTRPVVSNAKLLAHELAHNINMADFYPPHGTDTTYIMGTGEGSAGFKPSRMDVMKDYVTKTLQENPSCTGTTTQVTDMSGYVSPDVESAAKCNEYKCNGWCAEGHANYKWMMQKCITTCKTKECVPVDKSSPEECNDLQCQGGCNSNDQNYAFTMQECRATCANKKCTPVDKQSEEECNKMKCNGWCVQSHVNYGYALQECRNTCENKKCTPVDALDAATCKNYKCSGDCTGDNEAYMQQNCRKTCSDSSIGC